MFTLIGLAIVLGLVEVSYQHREIGRYALEGPLANEHRDSWERDEPVGQENARKPR